MTSVWTSLSLLGVVVLHTLLAVQGEEEGSTTPRVVVGDPRGKMWRKEEIPNPQIDVYVCGNEGSRAWICDPDDILNPEEARLINAEIEQLMSLSDDCQCPAHDEDEWDEYDSDESDEGCRRGYGGWRAGVAIVNRIRLPPSASIQERDDVGDEYTAYMREESWDLGQCDDDLVVLVSEQDRLVYTAVGDVMSVVLTDHCVTEIYESVRVQLGDGDFGLALVNMMRQYTLALRYKHDCNSLGSTNIVMAVIIVVVIIVVLIIVAVFVMFLKKKCRRTCRDFCDCEGTGRRGRKSRDRSGNYVATYKSSPRSSPRHSPRHSPRSSPKWSPARRDSGGGGGGF